MIIVSLVSYGLPGVMDISNAASSRVSVRAAPSNIRYVLHSAISYQLLNESAVATSKWTYHDILSDILTASSMLPIELLPSGMDSRASN
jgi:hypothetical protein